MKVYPINLVVENKKCIVVGGGKVAYRKICGLLDADAQVEVISPKVCDEISKLVDEGKITLIREKYSAEKISDGLILIAATNDVEVNRLAAEDARKKNFLVNVVTDCESDFTVPSKIIRGDFLLTISTGGNSPAFSKFVREMLETEFDSNFDEGLKIIAKLRREVKKILPDNKARTKFWREVLTPELWQLLKSGEVDKLKNLFQVIMEEKFMTYKLLAFDMDDTILTSDKKITSATVAKLDELSRRGVYVTVSTGRGIAELSDYKKDLQAVRYGILISGGIIYDFQNAQSLATHPVNENLILKLIDTGLDEGAMIHLLTLGSSITSQQYISQMEKFHMGIYQNMFERICTRCDDFKGYVRDNPGKVLKVNLYHTSIESRDRTVERMKNYDLNLVFAEGTSLEASPKNISKGSGLRELCEILKISVDECVAIGDGFNDLEILQTAGVGVAMGNARDEIKKIANYVTDDNNHDGVVKAIEKFF